MLVWRKQLVTAAVESPSLSVSRFEYEPPHPASSPLRSQLVSCCSDSETRSLPAKKCADSKSPVAPKVKQFWGQGGDGRGKVEVSSRRGREKDAVRCGGIACGTHSAAALILDGRDCAVLRPVEGVGQRAIAKVGQLRALAAGVACAVLKGGVWWW